MSVQVFSQSSKLSTFVFSQIMNKDSAHWVSQKISNFISNVMDITDIVIFFEIMKIKCFFLFLLWFLIIFFFFFSGWFNGFNTWVLTKSRLFFSNFIVFDWIFVFQVKNELITIASIVLDALWLPLQVRISNKFNVMGGFDNFPLNILEKYSVPNDEWEIITSGPFVDFDHRGSRQIV